MEKILEGSLPTVEIERIAQERLDALHAVEGAGGAVVTFAGVVRRKSQGHLVRYLEYQAYAPMAEREMARIVREVEEKWRLGCAMAHRVGRLEVGEASIVIAVASPHRPQAFEACRFAIDRVKESVPVWKKEVAEDGFWWVEDPLSGPSPVEVGHERNAG